MKYYSSWQEALIDYIELRGHEYESAGELYCLMEEFERQLFRNIKGTYYMKGNGK